MSGSLKKTTESKRGGARPGSGRKKAIHNELKVAIRDKARDHADEALRVLVEVAKDKKAPPAARVSAANALLDRGYGKPISEHEHNHKGNLDVRTKVGLVPNKAVAEVTTKPAPKDHE